MEERARTNIGSSGMNLVKEDLYPHTKAPSRRSSGSPSPPPILYPTTSDSLPPAATTVLF